MTSDLDIWRSVNLLMKRHVWDASIEGAMRADAMLEAVDLDGFAVWKRVLKVLGELQRATPGPSAAVH
jgi:hypothetical protein